MNEALEVIVDLLYASGSCILLKGKSRFTLNKVIILPMCVDNVFLCLCYNNLSYLSYLFVLTYCIILFIYLLILILNSITFI